jgi:hypothetical protein
MLQIVLADGDDFARPQDRGLERDRRPVEPLVGHGSRYGLFCKRQHLCATLEKSYHIGWQARVEAIEVRHPFAALVSAQRRQANLLMVGEGYKSHGRMLLCWDMPLV